MAMEYCRWLSLVSAVIAGILVGASLGNENAIGWGLPDAVAPVGKLFEFPLSKAPETSGHGTRAEAPPASDEVDGSGDVRTEEKRRDHPWSVFQIGENGRRFDLPPWLIFDSSKGKLYGVADHGSLGHNYRILVVYGGKASLSDEFSLRVIDDSSSSWSEPLRASSSSRSTSTLTSGRTSVSYPVRCPYGLSITTATVVLDLDPAKLSASDRVRIIDGFSRHFDLPAAIFRLRLPPHDRPLLDLNSALAAGPGDLGTGSSPQHGGLLVQWDVGCGNVRAELMPSLELLETSAANGRLGASLALHPPVIGWHIAKMTRGDVMGSGSPRRNPSYGKHHAPRFVVPTATPSLPIAVMPTARSDVITVTVQTPASTAVAPATTASVVVIIPTATMTSPKASAITWTTSTEGFETTTANSDASTPDSMTSRMLEVPVESTETEAAAVTSSLSHSETVAVLHPSVTTFDYETTEPSRLATTPLPLVVATTRTMITPKMTKMTKRPTKLTTPKTTPMPNQAPELRKPIGRLNVTAGKMLRFPIPIDMFVDREDGVNIQILFQDTNGLELTPMSWIKLNATSKSLFAFPMEADVGRHQYRLAGADSKQRMTFDTFEVTVERGPSTDHISHEFSVVLNIDYMEFLFKGVERRLEVAARIAAAFGDPDPGRIIVTNIRSGSVIYSWTNSTVPAGPPCPVDHIRKLAERIIDPVDGSTNPDFVTAMYPIPVKRAEFRPLGACAEDDRLRVGGASSGSFGGDVEVEPRRVSSSSSFDALLLVVIVSMVVVGVLLVLLVILCIVCCCRSRRQSEKQRRQRDDELSCANKGIPVIFADELDDYDDEADRKSSGTGTIGRGGNGNGQNNKQQPTPDDTPASTLKRRVRVADHDEGDSSPNGGTISGYDDDGRPAVPPPPEYPRSDPASRTSTLKSDYKSPLLLSEESDEDEVNDSRKANLYGNHDDGLDDGINGATRPLYHPQPPNSDSLPPYRKL